MSRSRNRLSATFVAKIKKPGRYPDGGGLYLQVTTGIHGDVRKSWVFRYTAPDGRKREMGFGAAGNLELVQVRRKADAMRRLLSDGVDPIEHRDAERERLQREAANAVTFKQAAEQYIEMRQPTWSNKKAAEQWPNTMRDYVYPVFGSRSVRAIDTSHVLEVLKPIWTTKNETAARLRARIERILDYATTRGMRSGDNPARWRGHLEHTLPAPELVKEVVPHPALPYADMDEFMKTLRSKTGMAAKALEFTILTAARTNEVLGLRWREINFEERMWTCPAIRMKKRRDHRVPLVGRALRILEEMKLDRSGDDLVFPGRKLNKPLSGMDHVLERIRPDVSVHGFRSTFTDWAHEQIDVQRETIEAAIAHVVGDKAEAAYRRGDRLEKRRELMIAWDAYCTRSAASALRAPKSVAN